MGVFFCIALVVGILIVCAPLIYTLISEIPRSCKNAAFREYKTRTYQRLEDEEQDFIKYLEAERAAQDKTAFEQFMASKK